MIPDLPFDHYKPHPQVDSRTRTWPDFSYTKIEKMGKGDQKVCWRARIGNIERAVLKQNFDASEIEELKHFQSVLRLFNGHPNVVHTHDFFWTTHRKFYGMYKFYIIQDCYKFNLIDGLNNGLFSNNPILIQSAFLQLADGLAFIHSKGGIVNDLKIDNIYYDADGYTFRFAYGDFGGADTLVKKSQLIVGDRNFRSPSRLNDHQRTQADDIFSLGMCFAFIPYDITKEDFPEFPYAAMIKDEKTSCTPYVHAFYQELKETIWKPLIGRMLSDLREDRPTAVKVLTDLKAVKT